MESGLQSTLLRHDFSTPLIPSEERGVGDQNIQKWGLVQLPTILMPAFILLRNIFKQYFTEKGKATAPLAHPLNSLMWRAEVLEKSAFFLFQGVITFVEILYLDPPYLPAP